MKSTGITRKIDRMVRIVIPMELRKTLNLPANTPIEIYVDRDQIVITAYRPNKK